MTKTSYTGEEVKAMLKEAGILHYQAAERLGISQNYFSVRLKGEFTDTECHMMGILPPLKYPGGAFEKDLKVIIQYYWNDFVNLISCDVVRKETLNGIINDIKQEHCRTIEVWDYTKENESC